MNHVRIPVGYWAFIQPDPGEPYISSGQKAQIERILGYCATYGINAIIDLHGLPGSQNGQDHSGHAGSIGFYSAYNIQRGLQTVQAVVDWMNALSLRLKQQICAIESANEPSSWADGQLGTLRGYYQLAYGKIHASAYQVPMVRSTSLYFGLCGFHRSVSYENAEWFNDTLQASHSLTGRVIS